MTRGKSIRRYFGGTILSLLLGMVLWLPYQAYAQPCTGGTFSGNLTMTSSFQTIPCIMGDQYYTFTAVLGNTYIFSFCQGGGASTWDTELTLLTNTDVPVIYNDFACNPGNRSEITWTATSSGTFRILATEWPCFNNATCAQLAYREIAAVGPGATCSNPMVIASLPFSVAGASTCGAGDEYNSTHACGSGYMNGEDFVYTYTTATPTCLDLSITNTPGSHGLFVLDGCPDAPGTSCLGKIDTLGGNSLSGVSLPTAGTYYIVVSSQDPPRGCISYDLTVDECPTGANCARPTVISAFPYVNSTLTTCGFGDDFDQNDACGSVYMNGDDYVFTYTAAGPECVDVYLTGTTGFSGLFITDACPDSPGATCIASDEAPVGQPNLSGTFLPSAGTYYITVSTSPSPQCTPFGIVMDTCQPAAPCGLNPPPADSCPIAPSMTGYASFCGRTNPAVYTADNPGNLNSVFCGVIDNNCWFSFVADSVAAVFNFNVGPCLLGLGVQAMVFSSPDCQNFTGVSNCWNPGAEVNGTVTATGLTVGNTYYLMVDGNAQDDCEFTVTYNGGPLPVVWGNLFGERMGDEVKLVWETQHESNNRGFFVEQGSTAQTGEAGALEWATVGFVPPIGGNLQTVEYSTTLSGLSTQAPLFFRIRQEDLNGYVQHSEIIRLLPEGESGSLDLELFPNPADATMNLRTTHLAGGRVEIFIYDLSGKCVFVKECSPQSLDLFETSIETGHLPTGLYHIRFQNGGKQRVIPFSVQR